MEKNYTLSVSIGWHNEWILAGIYKLTNTETHACVWACMYPYFLTDEDLPKKSWKPICPHTSSQPLKIYQKSTVWPVPPSHICFSLIFLKGLVFITPPRWSQEGESENCSFGTEIRDTHPAEKAGTLANPAGSPLSWRHHPAGKENNN